MEDFLASFLAAHAGSAADEVYGSIENTRVASEGPNALAVRLSDADCTEVREAPHGMNFPANVPNAPSNFHSDSTVLVSDDNTDEFDYLLILDGSELLSTNTAGDTRLSASSSTVTGRQQAGAGAQNEEQGLDLFDLAVLGHSMASVSPLGSTVPARPRVGGISAALSSCISKSPPAPGPHPSAGAGEGAAAAGGPWKAYSGTQGSHGVVWGSVSAARPADDHAATGVATGPAVLGYRHRLAAAQLPLPERLQRLVTSCQPLALEPLGQAHDGDAGVHESSSRSSASFLSTNLSLAGFGSPATALLQAVRECVENSLDAGSSTVTVTLYPLAVPPSSPSPPTVSGGPADAPLRWLASQPWAVSVEDDGTGLACEAIPALLGTVFSSTKAQGQGQGQGQRGFGTFGVGLKALLLYAQGSRQGEESTDGTRGMGDKETGDEEEEHSAASLALAPLPLSTCPLYIATARSEDAALAQCRLGIHAPTGQALLTELQLVPKPTAVEGSSGGMEHAADGLHGTLVRVTIEGPLVLPRRRAKLPNKGQEGQEGEGQGGECGTQDHAFSQLDMGESSSAAPRTVSSKRKRTSGRAAPSVPEAELVTQSCRGTLQDIVAYISRMRVARLCCGQRNALPPSVRVCLHGAAALAITGAAQGGGRESREGGGPLEARATAYLRKVAGLVGSGGRMRVVGPLEVCTAVDAAWDATPTGVVDSSRETSALQRTLAQVYTVHPRFVSQAVAAHNGLPGGQHSEAPAARVTVTLVCTPVAPVLGPAHGAATQHTASLSDPTAAARRKNNKIGLVHVLRSVRGVPLLQHAAGCAITAAVLGHARSLVGEKEKGAEDGRREAALGMDWTRVGLVLHPLSAPPVGAFTCGGDAPGGGGGGQEREGTEEGGAPCAPLARVPVPAAGGEGRPKRARGSKGVRGRDSSMGQQQGSLPKPVAALLQAHPAAPSPAALTVQLRLPQGRTGVGRGSVQPTARHDVHQQQEQQEEEELDGDEEVPDLSQWTDFCLPLPSLWHPSLLGPPCASDQGAGVYLASSAYGPALPYVPFTCLRVLVDVDTAEGAGGGSIPWADMSKTHLSPSTTTSSAAASAPSSSSTSSGGRGGTVSGAAVMYATTQALQAAFAALRAQLEGVSPPLSPAPPPLPSPSSSTSSSSWSVPHEQAADGRQWEALGLQGPLFLAPCISLHRSLLARVHVPHMALELVRLLETAGQGSRLWARMQGLVGGSPASAAVGRGEEEDWPPAPAPMQEGRDWHVGGGAEEGDEGGTGDVSELGGWAGGHTHERATDPEHAFLIPSSTMFLPGNLTGPDSLGGLDVPPAPAASSSPFLARAHAEIHARLLAFVARTLAVGDSLVGTKDRPQAAAPAPGVHHLARREGGVGGVGGGGGEVLDEDGFPATTGTGTGTGRDRDRDWPTTGSAGWDNGQVEQAEEDGERAFERALADIEASQRVQAALAQVQQQRGARRREAARGGLQGAGIPPP